LLTLYFLDSRPLGETLSVLLAQRSKTLHGKLSWTLESASYNLQKSNERRTEDERPAENKHTGFRSVIVREVRQALLTVLDVIFRTLKTSRDIFQVDPILQSSMVYDALEYIRSDSPDQSTTGSLHPELQLTTQKLLSTLPSSPHFLLLPQSLRSYKPYVDGSSSSSRIPSTQLTEGLDEWFRKSTKMLRAAAERWISKLRSVTEVWNVRSSTLKCIKLASGFEEQEDTLLKTMFDDLCRERLHSIWKSSLADAENSFSAKIESTVSSLTKGEDVPLAGELTFYLAGKVITVAF
jgi:hypothetical protein